MKVVYLAHPLTAPTREGIEANRRAAAKWAAWISVTFKVAVSADWIWMTGELEETKANRAHGIRCDKALARRADEIWQVGPRLTSGMVAESEGHPNVYDLTGIPLAPEGFRKATEMQIRHYIAAQDGEFL